MADDTKGWTLVEEPAMVASHDQQPDTSTGLKMAAAGAWVPVAERVAMEVATHPNAAKTGAAIGQVLGGVEGALKGGPLGAAGGVWTGGKAGWFTGKLAQRMAAPVANALEKVAPYAQTLSTLGGAASVGDLAQIAEPTRRDIGFLGIGPSVEPDVAMLTKAVKAGANPTQAAAQLTNGDPRKFAALITAYSQSLGQGR
jgi:hypothetical protein